MKKSGMIFCVIVAIVLVRIATVSAADSWSVQVPDGLGYNIHFTDPKPGEMEMLAESGVTIIRMDFSWESTERKKGVWDFSAYDRLTDACERFGIRPLYILDYSNRHYDEGLSPYTEEGRAAFVSWAVAAVQHFKGRNILWEMYNEPNIFFWRPEPNPEHYIALALAVGKAIREVAPTEVYIGPATSEIDLDFLEKCFQAGLLKYWDALSVHPYRQKAPETVIEEYARLRHLIDRYAPEGKTIPILSAEWGYSSAWSDYDDDLQGKMLPRQWMVNLSCNVPVSIWYDWHDDGTDPKEPEHHFGTTFFEPHDGRTPLYDPKPSYRAAKTFCETLREYRFNKRLFCSDAWGDDIFVYLFVRDHETALAVWTTDRQERTITIPGVSGVFQAVDYLGEKRERITATEDGVTVTISDGPLYLIPLLSQPLLQKLTTAPSLPQVVYSSPRYPTREAISGLPESPQPGSTSPFTVRCRIGTDTGYFQQVKICSADVLLVSSPAIGNDALYVQVRNPSGEPYIGTMKLSCQINDEQETTLSQLVRFEPGEKTTLVRFFIGTHQTIREVRIREAMLISEDGITDWRSNPMRLHMIDDFSRYTPETLSAFWEAATDGDANVGSQHSLILVSGEGDTKLEATYQFEPGWRFLLISPKTADLQGIEGEPKSLSLLIEGDGSGNLVRLRFMDSAGQTFQSDGGRLTDRSLQALSFPLNSSVSGHWGGPNDGVVRYPIQLDAIIIDGTRKATGPNTIRIHAPMLHYEEPE